MNVKKLCVEIYFSLKKYGEDGWICIKKIKQKGKKEKEKMR